jgi:transposase
VLVRLRKTLVDQRTAWQQRLHAVLFHHGLPCPDHALLTQATRGWLEQVALPQASRLQVTTALRQIDQLAQIVHGRADGSIARSTPYGLAAPLPRGGHEQHCWPTRHSR